MPRPVLRLRTLWAPLVGAWLVAGGGTGGPAAPTGSAPAAPAGADPVGAAGPPVPQPATSQATTSGAQSVLRRRTGRGMDGASRLLTWWRRTTAGRSSHTPTTR